jgi:hypothetical protein
MKKTVLLTALAVGLVMALAGCSGGTELGGDLTITGVPDGTWQVQAFKGTLAQYMVLSDGEIPSNLYGGTLSDDSVTWTGGAPSAGSYLIYMAKSEADIYYKEGVALPGTIAFNSFTQFELDDELDFPPLGRES